MLNSNLDVVVPEVSVGPLVPDGSNDVYHHHGAICISITALIGSYWRTFGSVLAVSRGGFVSTKGPYSKLSIPPLAIYHAWMSDSTHENYLVDVAFVSCFPFRGLFLGPK